MIVFGLVASACPKKARLVFNSKPTERMLGLPREALRVIIGIRTLDLLVMFPRSPVLFASSVAPSPLLDEGFAETCSPKSATQQMPTKLSVPLCMRVSSNYEWLTLLGTISASSSPASSHTTTTSAEWFAFHHLHQPWHTSSQQAHPSCRDLRLPFC